MSNNAELKKKTAMFLSKNLRFDGRKPDQYRKVIVEIGGISKSAEGSARVKIGDTEVIAGVKMAVEKPYPDTPEDGSMMIGAELLPLSSSDFEMGPPGIKAIEIARVVDRGIRESQAIDTKKLCIEAGEKVWMIIVDVCTINDAGNLMDASALAALAAIKDAKFPEYDGTKVDYKTLTDKSIPISKEPIAVTVYKMAGKFIVDPTYEEENIFDARLTVTTTSEGIICAMQKGGDETLTSEDIKSMVELALVKSTELRKALQG